MKLYIIGNGFDLEHGLPTKYTDFRNYIINTYPKTDEFDGLVPESHKTPDGDEIYNMSDVAGYICRIIDECEGGDWSDLEGYLGLQIYKSFLLDLRFESMDFPDREIWNAIYYNEDLSERIKCAFVQIKHLFYDWVKDHLGNIDYANIWKENIDTVLSEGDMFLCFNYTRTLENVYGIPNVCHIHGKVGDPEEDILFGHGNVGEALDPVGFLGAESNINELKMDLIKDTKGALDRNKLFFEKMKDVSSIHSFGFSYSDVDMFYIKKIARMTEGATWFINTYDANHSEMKKKIEKIIELKFKVEVDGRW